MRDSLFFRIRAVIDGLLVIAPSENGSRGFAAQAPVVEMIALDTGATVIFVSATVIPDLRRFEVAAQPEPGSVSVFSRSRAPPEFKRKLAALV